jgi:hypothetical protein
MTDDDKPRHCYRTIAKLAAAVIETSPAIGILWEAADAVWPADRFRTAVDQAGEDLPVEMLVSVKLAWMTSIHALTADGHTIGHDEHHKFTVHHEPSTIATGQTVYRLYLTSIPKP